jgi:hypothetical protein
MGVSFSKRGVAIPKVGGWLKSGYGMYWECFTVILGGVVGLKVAGHGGVDLKWAGHVAGVSLSH